MRSLLFLPLAVLSALASPTLANETHKLTAPADLQAANSDVPGTVKLTWQAVKGTTEYIVASSRETDNSWQSVAVTPNPSYEFVDLPEGTKYYFRVACNTKAGQGPWSNVVVLNTTPTKAALATQPQSANYPVRTQTSQR